ncbi:DAK2 domain-containing protein [Ructibacterium gallinarum]|uniref:DAK2 domain-containing protein n=1 Tax=Ructibacterium gallinarum TaxID=2779355 RepID=A0A9D5M690_9FIRM|nr:DAK2 domain-containing protein [Ructibacterium gallinarum]MBE5040262.1 DAK2 domain-containing protein [Ructibacterium gallinarum]
MEVIRSEEIRQMIASASNHLQNNRKHINDLNVFPVPDGDTGTNMGMTFGAAAEEALSSHKDATAGEILDVLAKSSLRNARGNSGVILSQILRGLAAALHGHSKIGSAEIAAAICESRDTAYRAVMKPTEGTILTVVRQTAEFAEEHVQNFSNPVEFLNALLQAAKESLDQTPEILPVLKQAGVVDAGGMGVVTLMEGAVAALNGHPVALSSEAAAQQLLAGQTTKIPDEEIKFLYCTEFLIHKTPERQTAQFNAAIRSKGDCMLVIEDEEVVKVHIHTNHPGFVIEQALKLGELTNLKIDNMKYQHEERIGKMEQKQAKPQKQTGFVAVSAGDGLDEVFRSVGIDVVVEGGQTMNPSTQDLLNAVQRTGAQTVFIFPNNKNIILAAEQVDELTPQKVIVIPTKNIPQGISAMLAFDEEADIEENEKAMLAVIDTVKCGQITFAARNSAIDGFEIHKGDIMGMLGGKIQKIGKDINEVTQELVHGMIDEDSGMITIYYGKDVDRKTAEALEKLLADKYEYLDISLIYGGQPVYYYFVAVE